MFWKIRWFITAVVLTLAVALTVFLGVGLVAAPGAMPVIPALGRDAPGRVLPGAVLKEENRYLCGDVELVYQAPVSADMLGSDLKDLRRKYSEADGWSVEINDGKLVVLRKNVEGFCGQHSLYRHLGIHRDRLAVFQGPLGFDQRILRVEEKKKVEDLPRTLREKLYKSREFDRLPAEEKSSLRRDLEFIDEASLNSVLENLDEMPNQVKNN
ncbi:MAG: hypothetical protein K6T66_12230 [Peptococcaceae bacterium]|nr:hypothetical protein [Peptococcaceae bacterium]